MTPTIEAHALKILLAFVATLAITWVYYEVKSRSFTKGDRR